ncbi:MAG: hypothetical protein QXJ13_07505 [Candidatus Bathyarchaeia archaeon]
MSVEQYFDTVGVLLRVLILIAFALIFLYIFYCEREKIVPQKASKEVERASSQKP